MGLAAGAFSDYGDTWWQQFWWFFSPSMLGYMLTGGVHAGSEPVKLFAAMSMQGAAGYAVARIAFWLVGLLWPRRVERSDAPAG